MEILNRFPSPSEKETFKKYWNMYLCDIKDRENLKPSHLQQLRVIKIRPEVAQLNRVVTEIRNYSKILGLVLAKDTTTTKEEEPNEFD
jgi:hypothetical protein